MGVGGRGASEGSSWAQMSPGEEEGMLEQPGAHQLVPRWEGGSSALSYVPGAKTTVSWGSITGGRC